MTARPAVCWICLRRRDGESSGYHPRCLKRLFGVERPPDLAIELARLHTAALAMVGRASLSGIQRKVSVGLSTERDTLQVAMDGGRFLLKPQTPAYPGLPENEWVSTRLAELTGIATAVSGLVRLQDGSFGYLSRRFDRLPDGRKLRQEDFCQLASKSPKEKYEGTAELCVRIVRQHTAEPPVESLKLFKLMLFSWWSGNGDMHLKNFSLTADEQGRQRLSPAYDLACTRLVLPDDPLALPVQGLKDGLTLDTWLAFGDYCRLPRRACERAIEQQRAACEPACALIADSPLDEAQREAYCDLLRRRTGELSPPRPRGSV